MRSRPRPARRWLAATLVTLAVHGVVFLGLSRTPARGPAAEPPIIDISLAPIERPRLTPPPPAPAPTKIRNTPLQLHQPPAVFGPVQGSGLQGGPAAPGTAPGPPGPAPAPAPANPKMKFDCLHLGPAAKTGVYGRVDCDQQRYAKLKGQDDAVTEIMPNPAWDAQIARQMQVHRPLPAPTPSLGNCPNQNLGLGCLDEELLPVAKRKF